LVLGARTFNDGNFIGGTYVLFVYQQQYLLMTSNFSKILVLLEACTYTFSRYFAIFIIKYHSYLHPTLQHYKAMPTVIANIITQL